MNSFVFERVGWTYDGDRRVVLINVQMCEFSQQQARNFSPTRMI